MLPAAKSIENDSLSYVDYLMSECGFLRPNLSAAPANIQQAKCPCVTHGKHLAKCARVALAIRCEYRFKT